MDIQLKIGKTYRFTHKTKGTFIAQLIDIVPTPENDPNDTRLLQVKYDTRKGSGQEWMARTNAPVHVSNLRPSKISHCELVESNEWLQEQHVIEESKREQHQYEQDLKRMVKTILDEAKKEEPKKKPGIIESLKGRFQIKH